MAEGGRRHRRPPGRGVRPAVVRHRPRPAHHPHRTVRVSHPRLRARHQSDQDRPVRRVSITTQARDALLQHRSRAEQAAADNHRTVESADLVFTNDPAGRRPWRPELVTRRWERHRAAAGMPGVRIHDIRHFVATELLTAGIDVRTVANRLGHARTSTTKDIYWGFVPARDRAAADHLQRVLE